MRYFTVLFVIWYNEVSIHGKFQDHTCDIKEFQSVFEVSSWTNEILQSQDKERRSLLQRINTSDLKASTRAEVLDSYYHLTSLVSSNECHVLKKMAGKWMKCGFLDGEKLLCMDNLYNAILNGTCLVYSFGLADNWDFEIFMAELGCTVRAYDPTTRVERPDDSLYVDNLHYYNMGIAPEDGKGRIWKEDDSPSEIIKVKSLETLIKENGDSGKEITYLKLDVEGTEIGCMKKWLQSGVMKYVQQLGVEMHTGIKNVTTKSEVKNVFASLIKFMQEIKQKYGLSMVAYNPNLCQGKKLDRQKTYYPYHDILFVKRISHEK